MQPSGGAGGGPDHKAFWIKKTAAREMWCNRDATVPLDLFTPQHAKVVFFSALCGFQASVSSYVDTAGCNISHCARHSVCHVQSWLRRSQLAHHCSFTFQ